MKQRIMFRYRERFRRFAWSLFFINLLLLPPPSSQASSLYRFHQVSMGTAIEITLIGHDQREANKAALQAFQEMKRIEQLMSPKMESGDVFRINQFSGKERVKVSKETFAVIKKAQEISELTAGGFDITIGPIVDREGKIIVSPKLKTW